METYNYPIDFNRINKGPFEDKKEAFENLCKEYLEIEYETSGTFILGNPSNYPGIEAKPIKTKKGEYISFQAKYIQDKNQIRKNLLDSFWNNKGNCKIKESNLDKLDLLYIIVACDINKTIQNEIESKLKNEKKSLNIIFITKKLFENILQQKKYTSLRLKYFYNKDVEREWLESNKHLPDISLLIPFIGLNGMPDQKSIELANKEFKEYQINKLCYAGTDCFTAFNDMEDSILKDIGSTLEGKSEFEDNFSFWDLLESTRSEVNEMINTNPNGSRIMYFLPEASHKRGVTLQHHQDKKVIIEIKKSKAIYKINHKNDGNRKNS